MELAGDPGATVAQDDAKFDPEALHGYGEPTFAGGASDGSIGCAAMDFAHGGLTAKKAWFFFDEGMVALGAGITAHMDAPVRTTINQCRRRGPAFLAGATDPLPEETYPLAAGAAFRQDGVTYRILDGTGQLRLGAQSGAWSDCGVGSPERLSLNMMNAGLEHGVRPCNASYAYAVLPGGEGPADFGDDPAKLVIVRNDAEVQAVWHTVDRRGHAVCYAPGKITFPDGQQLGVDLPCILLYHPREDGSITLTLAQPEQHDGLLTLTLVGRHTLTLSVSLPAREYAGSSMSLVLSLPR